MIPPDATQGLDVEDVSYEPVQTNAARVLDAIVDKAVAAGANGATLRLLVQTATEQTGSEVALVRALLHAGRIARLADWVGDYTPGTPNVHAYTPQWLLEGRPSPYERWGHLP
jgi:hypothetical protein